MNKTELNKALGTEETAVVEERDFTEEQSENQMKAFENDIIQGLIAAADTSKEVKKIEICRNGTLYFSFHIRPLSEDEYTSCKKKYTKYVRNKQFGMKVPEETNTVKYRAAIIYKATVEKDRNELWDNKQVWNALNANGCQIMNGLDVIEYTLRAGEKDRVIEEIDNISGFNDDLEEIAKN